MTEFVKELLTQLKDKSYKEMRNRTEEMPIIYPVDFFGFNKGKNEKVPCAYGNLTPDYKYIISNGFDTIREKIIQNIKKTEDEKKIAFGNAMLNELDLCIKTCEKHRELAKEKNNIKLYNALLKIPKKGAESFYEACVFIKLCIYFLRNSGVTHIGLGRFDQYMYSFYCNDKENGITDDEIFETLEAFFISLNFDTDLYVGVQQGDNGQSMVLGGFDKDGKGMYNKLTDMCMQASLELNLIDPKINLRVGKNTPDEMFLLGTKLTKKGLGFPQYCNDDVVVSGLIRLGYEPEDAIDYVVAACWEYIIPGKGADIPNKATMNFPLVVNNVIKSKLEASGTFDELMVFIKDGIRDECDRIIKHCMHDQYDNQTLLSSLTESCVESLSDIWNGGAKYMNFGCHGAGIANAADALAAVKKNIFEEKKITKKELLDALDADFEGFTAVRNLLRQSPKMGNNDDYVDDIASCLMRQFSVGMNKKDNGHGGIWRAGTGSAMEYIWSAAKCPATADGRKAHEPYSSSFSPSLDVKTNGLLSVIQSFTKYDMRDIINGGPLTLEIHDSVLKNDVGVQKTAQLVKAFINLGGHQLQLNAINKDRLIDAQKHPELYPDLIVRVWGWSGYFNELDFEYQNHIIRRCQYRN